MMFSYPDKSRDKKPRAYETLGQYIDRVIIGLPAISCGFAETKIDLRPIELSLAVSLKKDWTISKKDDVK